MDSLRSCLWDRPLGQGLGSGHVEAECILKVLGVVPWALSSLAHQVLLPPKVILTPVKGSPPGPSLSILWGRGVVAGKQGGWRGR